MATHRKATAAKSGRRAPRGADGAAPPGDAQRERLEGELAGLIRQVDAEGLIFLIRQAQVLVRNLQVDRINREVEALRGADDASPDPHAPRAAGERQTFVDIEEVPGGLFHLTVGSHRSTMGTPEMREVVRLCYAPETKSDALRGLHAWFDRERRDVLLNANVRGPEHPFFRLLFDAVRARFRLKDR